MSCALRPRDTRINQIQQHSDSGRKHAYPDLGDGQLLIGETREHADITGPTDLRVGVTLGGVVHRQLGEVLERARSVKVQGAQLVGVAGVSVE